MQRSIHAALKAVSSFCKLNSTGAQISVCMHAEFEQDIVHMTPCEVHIFDPTLSLGTQQQLRQVKEFDFHDTGLIAEGVKVAAPNVMTLLSLLPCPSCNSSQMLSQLSTCWGRRAQDTFLTA